MTDRQDLTGFFYALVSGLPGTSKSMRTKAFRKRDLAEGHVESLTRRFPTAKVEGYFRVAHTAPNEALDRPV